MSGWHGLRIIDVRINEMPLYFVVRYVLLSVGLVSKWIFCLRVWPTYHRETTIVLGPLDDKPAPLCTEYPAILRRPKVVGIPVANLLLVRALYGEFSSSKSAISQTGGWPIKL